MALFNNIIDKAKPKTKKMVLYTILETFAVLLMCFVGGCFDWVHLKFTFDKFGTWEFYESVLQKWILYSCALIVGLLFKIQKEEMNNQEYFSELNLYKEWLKSKKESFIDFIENIFNPNTKKRYIKLSVEHKLLKLDKRAKDQWKVEFNDAIKSKDFANWKWSNEKVKKYADERVRLTRLSSKEYIDENWKTINQKYPTINPHIFTESIHKNIKPDEEYKVENQTVKEMGAGIGKKFISILCISIGLSLFALDPQANELLEQAHGWIVMIIKYIIRVGMIIGNLAFGMYSGKEMFYENFILPIKNRIRILAEYVNWLKISKIENTWADEVMLAVRILKEEREKQKEEQEQPPQEPKPKEEFIEVEMTEDEMKANGLIK